MTSGTDRAAATRRVYISKDEWWPVFSIDVDDLYPEIELPIELIERAQAAELEFRKVQALLREAYQRAE